jgi:hypothetical protein
VVQPVVVLGDPAVAQSAVAAGQPGDGPFDHGPVLAVFGQPVRVTSGLAGGALPRIVRADVEALTGAAPGASGPQRAMGAGRAEGDVSGAADRAGQPVGASRRAGGVVDGEVINAEPSRTADRVGAGLTRSMWPHSASSARNSPVP